MNAFDLTDSSPQTQHARPRPRVTMSYAFDATAADRCTDVELTELAGNAARYPSKLRQLCGSPSHVEAMCRLLADRLAPALLAANRLRARDVRDLQAQLAAAQAIAAQLELQIDAANNAHQVTSLELESERASHRVTHSLLIRELGACIEQGRRAEVLNAENDMLRGAFATLSRGEDFDHDNDLRLVDVPAGP